VVNVFAARYYQLLEHERALYLGLRAIDTLAAAEYISLRSVKERADYYELFWQEKEEKTREQFEERVAYAVRAFGRYAPLSDDRIPTYVKYGPPSRREEITPEKKIAVQRREQVKPAEIWTYRREGLKFDFIRFTRAYDLIARSECGEHVAVPFFAEIEADTGIEVTRSTPLLDFSIGIGRFRQRRNLTRLEVYIACDIEDTTALRLHRIVRVWNMYDSLVGEQNDMLVPQGQASGTFFDEVNFWLKPDQYRCEIEMADVTNKRIGTRETMVSLVDYQNDAKEISDLIPAKLIDDGFTHEKFHKPVGRVIPLTETVVPVFQPFYFYAEVYNLETKNGLHQLSTTYEVTNKERMRREVVDVMIRDYVEPGDIAFLAAEYHPMDLAPGHYIITMRVKDILSGKERTAVNEFELRPPY
jgi:GWxTD domain-containing protein